MQERIRTMLSPDKLVARPAIRLNLPRQDCVSWSIAPSRRSRAGCGPCCPSGDRSMKKLMLCIVVLAALIATPALRAQTAAPPAPATHAPGDLSGNWQGTLKAGKDLRIIFNIYKGDKDGWS